MRFLIGIFLCIASSSGVYRATNSVGPFNVFRDGEETS